MLFHLFFISMQPCFMYFTLRSVSIILLRIFVKQTQLFTIKQKSLGGAFTAASQALQVVCG